LIDRVPGRLARCFLAMVACGALCKTAVAATVLELVWQKLHSLTKTDLRKRSTNLSDQARIGLVGGYTL
jgi:hypothetical protein